MFLPAITLALWALFAKEISAMLCNIGQEPDPMSGNTYRWVIPVKDPCLCTHLELVSLNIRAPCRPFPVTYFDSSDLDIDQIRRLLNCPPEEVTTAVSICSSGILPLGMKDGTIQDNKITASSYYDPGCRAYMARLDSSGEAWCANDDNPWIQVEFTAEVYITGVITQGADWGADGYEWVTAYQVTHSSDGQSWDYLTDSDDTPTTFVGNTDANSHVETTFTAALRTKYIRILPTAFSTHRSMRFELLGCNN